LTVLYPYYDHISTLSYIFRTPCLVKNSYCRSSHAILGPRSTCRRNCSQIFLRRYRVIASRISFYPPNPLRWSEAFSFTPSGKSSEIDVHANPVNRAFCEADLADNAAFFAPVYAFRSPTHAPFATSVHLNKIPFIRADGTIVSIWR
jgi:hypothetical protein